MAGPGRPPKIVSGPGFSGQSHGLSREEQAISDSEEQQERLTPEETAQIRRLMDHEDPARGTEGNRQIRTSDLQEVATRYRRPIKGMDAVRMRDDPQADEYAPTLNDHSWEGQDAVALYEGVGPGRVVKWKRRPDKYPNLPDEVARLMYEFEDAKIVTRVSDGKPLWNDDLVAVSIPKEYETMYQEDEEAKRLAWEPGLEEGDHHDSITRTDPDMEAHKRRARAAAEARSRALGIGSDRGSPTGGLDYRAAMRTQTKEDRLNMEARNREGGRHRHIDEQQAEMQDRANAAAVGRKQFGGLGGIITKGR